MRSGTLAVALIAVMACESATQPVGPLRGHATTLAQFELRLDTLRQRLLIPGMSAAIGGDTGITWQHVYGLADVDANRAVTASTTFHLASLTKAFATVVLLRLVDEGRLSLDDPITKFGVSVPNSSAVKVRHLLSMTSGDPVGDKFAYDGDRFALLTQIINTASGSTFAALVRDWITQPLGLVQTAPNVDSPAFSVFGMDPDAFRGALAKGYELSGGKMVPKPYPTLFSTAAGMI
ncbi:MAG TPA: serine hydrolase domain-containing protein, partial [Gemmatimonadaceae bacterium]|nr:serine hydrolase domain-containing protein [Gemmatimonadaceae bacterium]